MTATPVGYNVEAVEAWLGAHVPSLKQPLRWTRLEGGHSNLTYLLEAAAAGLGVAIAPEELVSTDIASGRLLAPWGFVETGGEWALCALRGNTDARIPALADWLRDELNGS